MTTATDPVFAMVTGQAADGFLVVATILPGGGPPDVQAFGVHEVEAARDYATAMARTRQVYLESALQRTKPTCGKRGTVDNASQLSLVSLDFDGAWGVHKKTALPTEPEDLQRLLTAAGAPRPTLVLETGGGLLALWALDTSVPLVGDAHPWAKSLSTAFQQRLRKTAQDAFGWKLDATHDLCRLIRVPGTLNHKFDTPRSVRVWDEMSSGIAVPVEIVETFAQPPAAPKSTQSLAAFDAEQEGIRGSWTSILAGCAFAQWCVENGDGMPEPEWYALAGLLARCEDGAATFHEISSQDHRYDSGEAAAKFDHAKSATPPRTCRSIHEDLGFARCRRCAFWRHA